MQDLKEAARRVLLNNLHGPFLGLPRTAAWGYPEPYTRDWMISALGILVSKDDQLVDALRDVLSALGQRQTRLGNIPSLANDPKDCGASDTTPLFLIGLALFRSVTGEARFLEEAAQKSLAWLAYQSPDDSGLIAQQPTSDWRDEQWVWGYALYVNTLAYASLRLYGLDDRARSLHALLNAPAKRGTQDGERIHEGLSLEERPYYALWAYKIHHSARFDLPGNSLAILFGLADRSRAGSIIDWAEESVGEMQARGLLACDLPPCLMPFIQPEDGDWHPRYAQFNLPGEYHNGGLWPFTLGFYIAALVAAGRYDLAAQKMTSLSGLVRRARDASLDYGFNEWLGARDCSPRGQDWQTWSAAMYLYAAACVEQGRTPFFDEMRGDKS